MSDRTGLTFRSNYFGDPTAWRALAGLMQDVFSIDVTVLDRLGGPDPSSVAFGWFDTAGACIANFTAFSLPLMVEGRVVRAAGLQSGAVRPDHRGRGLYGDVVQAALAHCDADGFEAVALLTDTPALYRRHGFEPVEQHRFAGPAPAGGTARPVRRLEIGNAADMALLGRLLDDREPVSSRFAPLRQKEMFLFNASLMPDLRLDLMDKNIVLAWQEGEDGGFELLDIVGARIPALADILASFRIAPSRAVVHFAPDRLSWEGEALPDTGDMTLMLRTRNGLRPKGPFALPPMAEF